MSASEAPGFDVVTVDAWLAAEVGAVPPIDWTLLGGGNSNLTYLLCDARGREMVIRRPPLGPLLPKAHDMWREFRIIEALWPTAVPVARPIAYCDDRAISDAHFYVMAKASGSPLYTADEAAAWLDVPARRRAGEHVVDVIASLHSIEPSTVGLEDLGRHGGYVERQLATWYRAWNAQVDSAGYDDERIHEMHDELSARLPPERAARIVHGDFGPHNALFSSTGAITAVLDWELATLGDPLADLGYTLNAWVDPGEPGTYNSEPPTALPGFPRRQEMIERYAAATGADLSNLDYYRAFSAWKLACILHGVYSRYRTGQKSAEGVDVENVFRRITSSIDMAQALLAR